MSAAVAVPIQVTETGPQQFALVVTFDGQRFECGSYLNRVAALQAGKLFVERKEGERVARLKRPKKKKK